MLYRTRFAAPGFIALFICLLSSLPALTYDGLPDAKPEDVGLSSEKLKRIDAWMKAEVDEKKLSGVSVAIMRHGKVAYIGQAGVADMENVKPITPDTFYRLASMTKPVTAVALMMMYEEGKFQLDDPLSKFMPEFKDMKVYAGEDKDGKPLLEPARRPITMRHILAHTAGFAGNNNDHAVEKLYAAQLRDRSEPRALMLSKLAKMPLMFHPGETWYYSRAPEVQAGLVELFSGLPLDVFFEKRIFGPLKMEHTTYYLEGADKEKLAQLYKRDEKTGTLEIAPQLEPLRTPEMKYIPGGGGGLIGTMGDYLRFSQMLVNGGELNGVRLLKEETVALMMQDHVPTTTGPKPGGIEGYGFGLGGAVLRDVAKSQLPGSVGEYNWAGLLSTLFWVDRRQDLAVVLMTQFSGKQTLRKDLKPLVYEAIEK